MPIPNDDPACHCTLVDAETSPHEGTVVVAGGTPELEARVLLHLDCPHHGGIVQVMRRTSMRSFSADQGPTAQPYVPSR